MRQGWATIPLDVGKCPPWLFERMKRLARAIIFKIIEKYSPEEFLRRISHPVWFQSFGCALGFDWNSSGLTTTTLGAIKEALKGYEKEIGIFVCGGKGKTSLKTPDEIQNWAWKIGFSEKTTENLIYASKISAKVDNALLQDGFSLYHHNLIFTKSGHWAVVQQGMNIEKSLARRYHWLSFKIKDFFEEPHSGVASQIKVSPLNLVAKKSKSLRDFSPEILKKPEKFLKDFLTIKMKLHDVEYHWHPVLKEKFDLARLRKTLYFIKEREPQSFKEIVEIKGVGPKTIRALCLVGEIIYGKKVSFEDPARYSFCHGGKDGTPYPVDKKTYDEVLEILEEGIKKSDLSISEKEKSLKNLEFKFKNKAN